MSDRYPTSAKLLAGIHRADERAIREFFLRYAPLLRDQARKLGLDGDQSTEMMTTLLDDVVLHLIEYRLAPRDLACYLVAAFRNRARRHHRDLNRRGVTRAGAYSEIGGAGGQRVVAECTSEYTIGTSGAHDAAPPSRAVLAKLVQRLESELTTDELSMLIEVGRHMPLRDIADRQRITYGAARVRLHRLRERLRKVASQYVSSLEPDERREIEKFLSRAAFTTGPPMRRVQREPANDQQ